MFISFILPCYNEELSIPVFLPKVIQFKKKILKAPGIKGMEILVVDDGSTDQSPELLKAYSEEIILVPLKVRQGYGTAVKEGIKRSQGDWIAFCDLDETCDSEDLKLFIELAVDKSLKAVWGDRLSKQSNIPLIRRLGNRFYQLVFFLLTFQRIPDPCSGFRLFNKSAFTPDIYTFPKNLSFSLAFTSYCIRYQIPFSTLRISYKERLGESKLYFLKDGVVFLWNLVRFLYF